MAVSFKLPSVNFDLKCQAKIKLIRKTENFNFGRAWNELKAKNCFQRQSCAKYNWNLLVLFRY